MRIAMISTPFVPVPPRAYGGTELVVACLVKGLLARGHEVTLYATGDSSVGGRVRALYPRAVWPPNVFRELTHVVHAVRDVMLADDVDVVHAHSAAALVFARFLGVPLVYTVHHHRDEALCELYREVKGPSVTMVAISRRQRDLIADTCDASVVWHGLEVDEYPLGHGLGGYAAFLGRFAPEKGVHTAIDVALRARVPLRLAGSPHDLQYHRTEVEPRLRGPSVTWIGEASFEPKLALLGGAVATLFPIDWEEPFGLVMVESMLCGTPVLAFPRGSTREVVDDGITGWVVDGPDEMAERLERLALGPGHFNRGRCRAHAARRFGQARMVDEYLTIYEHALAGPSVTPSGAEAH